MAKTTTAVKANKTVAPAAAEVQAKEPSKMDRARQLFKEIYTPGFDLKGESQRKVFIARAQSEVGLTKAGANTYFQNLSNEAKGADLYKYNQYARKPKADEAPADTTGQLPGAAPTKAAVKKAESQVMTDLTKRWQVLNTKKGNVVNSFGAKKDAEAYASQVKGLEVVDSKAKAS